MGNAQSEQKKKSKTAKISAEPQLPTVSEVETGSPDLSIKLSSSSLSGSDSTENTDTEDNDNRSDGSDEAPLSPSSQQLTDQAKFNRTNIHNSCWTLYVDSTVTKPNLQTTLQCVAHIALREILKNEAQNVITTNPLFEEQAVVAEEIQAPTHETIFNFLNKLFSAVQLSADSAVIMLVYVHRMLEKTKIAILPTNWRRILLGGLLMASKVWDDLAVWNVDFVTIMPDVDVKTMNLLERFYLTAMEFNVNVKSSVFAECYFLLREVAQSNNTAFSLEPLNSNDAKRLEAQMRAYSHDIRSKYSDTSDRVVALPNNMRRVKSESMFVGKQKTAYVL